MTTPFPGMDPYLEHPALWEDVHTRLIVAIADSLGPQVRPHYRVAVERRTYLAVFAPEEYELVGKPDVLISGSQQRVTSSMPEITTRVMPRIGELVMPDEITERYLEVRDVVTSEVVTVLELLSPTNKLTREGRSQYERKRLKVLGSATHLIEIDLLRAGEPFPMRIQSDGSRPLYRIVVSRSQDRPRAEVYLFDLPDPIPEIPIPLRANEADAVLPLNQVLHDMYDRAGYDQILNYHQPPVPALTDADAAWALTLI
ncbi:MAG: DUF4058 family protein [Chloroflexota bacterium]|nr:DUF4058 family protein [Chloroflexota bacterium]